MVWQIFALLQIFHLTVFFPEFACHRILWIFDLSTKNNRNILYRVVISIFLKAVCQVFDLPQQSELITTDFFVNLCV